MSDLDDWGRNYSNPCSCIVDGVSFNAENADEDDIQLQKKPDEDEWSDKEEEEEVRRSSGPRALWLKSVL